MMRQAWRERLKYDKHCIAAKVEQRLGRSSSTWLNGCLAFIAPCSLVSGRRLSPLVKHRSSSGIPSWTLLISPDWQRLQDR
jgi:hypothetical protein